MQGFRNILAVILAVVAVSALLAACASDESDLPAREPIEKGTPVALDAQQQEAVVMAVTKAMKETRSIMFGPIEGARNSHGRVAVCGQVNGKDAAGKYIGASPFIGVLTGTSKSPEFVVVGIGSSSRERLEVTTLCRASGVQAL
jgi:hypothetical protein